MQPSKPIPAILRKNCVSVEKVLYNKLDFGVLMDLETLYKMDYAIYYIYFLSKKARVDMWWKEGRNAVIDAQVSNGYYYSLQACHQPPTGWFLTVFRIRIHLFWIRIRHVRLDTIPGLDPGF
jgi:hypothetical protein